MKRALRFGAMLFWVAAVFYLPWDVESRVNGPADEMRLTEIKGFLIRSDYAVSKEDLLELRRQLWNARREIGQDLGEFPEHTFEVIVAKKDAFRAYSGLPESISGLFDGKLHIPFSSGTAGKDELNGILWHEYTHAVIHLVAQGNCPVWLNQRFSLY